MPTVRLYRGDALVHEQAVATGTNLVVLAGIRQFPLRYGCGMGRCTKCKIRVLRGGEHLAPPNWKEKKMLGEQLRDGYRLACQLFITHDLDIRQDEPVR